ncbi:hypothetical protein BC829DRAFT_491314 [Chytridium lagenaria]|nr:hypothetical protein BC829DRAFT_491314 [Chytridium lagenaria]
MTVIKKSLFSRRSSPSLSPANEYSQDALLVPSSRRHSFNSSASVSSSDTAALLSTPSSPPSSFKSKLPKVEVHVRPKALEVMDAGHGVSPIFVKDHETGHPSTKPMLSGSVRFFTAEAIPVSFVAVYLVGTISFDVASIDVSPTSANPAIIAWQNDHHENGRSPPSHLNHTFYSSDPFILWPVNMHGKALPSKHGAVPLKTQLDFDIPFPWSHVAPTVDIPGSVHFSKSSPKSKPNKLAVRFRDEDDSGDASQAPSPRKKGAFSKLFTLKSGDKNVAELEDAGTSPQNTDNEDALDSLSTPTLHISSIAAAATGINEILTSSAVAQEALGVPSIDTLMRKMNGTLPDAQIVSKPFSVKYISAFPQSQLVVTVVKSKASEKSEWSRKAKLRAGAIICTVSTPQPLVMGTQVMVEVNVDVLDKKAVGRVRAVSVGLSSSTKFDMDAIPISTLHTSYVSTTSSPDDAPLDTSSIPPELFSYYASNQSAKSRTLTRANPEYMKFSSSESDHEPLIAMMFLDVPKSLDELSTEGPIGGRNRFRRGKQDTPETDGVLIKNESGLRDVGTTPVVACGPSVKLPFFEIRHHIRIDVYHELEPSDHHVPYHDDDDDPFSDLNRTDIEDVPSSRAPTAIKKKKKKLGRITMYVPVRVVQAFKPHASSS